MELELVGVALETQEEECKMEVVLVDVMVGVEVPPQEVAEVDMTEVALLPEDLVKGEEAVARLEPE